MATLAPALVETAAGGSEAAEVEGLVPSALRGDLTVSHQVFEGHAYVIVKDPLSLKYFRLRVEDYDLARCFDGKRSVREVREAYVRRHPQAALTQSAEALRERIVAFANELLLGGFLEATAAGTRRQLLMAKLRRRPVTPWGLFMKGLFLKLPLWDPDDHLTWLERRLRWVWTWAGLWVSLGILLAGVGVFVTNFPRIAPGLNDFLTLPNLAWIWVLTILVKVVHEFGHGLTCKHYGGEVHEMGALVIVFSPFLYADVSDSYLFPKRRQRILVAAAGIYIELVIAAVATLLWAVSQPGQLQQLLFNLLLITSVWTVLFNANPLMKFDGYYILTDLIGVPNLRAKAQMCVSELCRKLLYGGDTPAAVERALPRRNRTFFGLYSVAAQLYLLQITLGIAMLFHYLLTPYGLSWLGDAIGAGALVSMVIVPVMSFFKNHQKTARQQPGGWRRPAGIVLGTLAAAAALLLCPWQVVIERPSLLRPEQSAWVRAEVPGRLAEIAVHEGQTVQKGQVLARLTNARLSSEVETAALRVQQAQRQVDYTLGADSPAYFRQAKSGLAQAEVALAEAQRLAARLELRAPMAGVVLTRDLQRLTAGSLRPGDALCEIAALDPLQLYIPLGERQARSLRAGQRVELRTAAHPARTHTGHIAEDRKASPIEELPPNLVATLGGDIPAQPDEKGVLRPIETTYGILVTLPNPDGALRPGMTGTARLHGDRLSLGEVLWQRVLDFISLDYRL